MFVLEGAPVQEPFGYSIKLLTTFLEFLRRDVSNDLEFSSSISLESNDARTGRKAFTPESLLPDASLDISQPITATHQ